MERVVLSPPTLAERPRMLAGRHDATASRAVHLLQR